MGQDEYVRRVVAEQGNREAMKYLRRKRHTEANMPDEY